MTFASDANIAKQFYDQRMAADRPPVTPDSFDDEFTDPSLSSWTQQNEGTPATWTVRKDNRLYLHCPLVASGAAAKGLIKAVPGATYTIETKLSGVSYRDLNFQKPAGIILAEGTTSQAFVYFGVRQNAGGGLTRWVGTNWSTFSSESQAVQPIDRSQLYLRMVNVAGSYTWQFSADGYTWLTHATAGVSFTPTLVGIGCIAENNSEVQGACFEWIRRTA